MVMVRLPDELVERIDALRGDVPRERWVRRVLVIACADQKAVGGALTLEQREAMAKAVAQEREALESLGKKVGRASVEGTSLPKIAPRRWAK